MSQPGKVKGQQAFVLHAQPYKETSMLVEMFTRDHGRVGLVARGARRPRAGIRALLDEPEPVWGRAEAQPGELRLDVADNGLGIATNSAQSR